MASFEVTLLDGAVEWIHEADAYQQEGQMTTIFRTSAGRATVDSWSVRVASFRTSDIRSVRRVEAPATAEAGSRAAQAALAHLPR
ncbi:MAG: hypothetical protein HYX34_10400 [Actinobacteria bacterium]|nr:hypothetical protein [Actinomycetota bacterium]